MRPPRLGTRIVAAVVVLVGLLAAVLVAVPALMVMGTAATSASGASDDLYSCLPDAAAGGMTITLDDDQLANARTVVDTGAGLDVPGRGLVVAIAAALQESALRNLDDGDRDSVGLFQQRSGWGSLAERTDPRTAATMFYTGGRAGQPGLLDIAGWPQLSIAAAAQAVQRSAYPLAYAKWETLATALVASVIGDDPLACGAPIGDLPTGAVGDMLRVALAQQGDPYVWGATGPDAFDCSGLVVYSWRQAGYQLNVRTAAQMYDESTEVAAGSEQPGDLLFGEFGPAGAGHVMIVIRPGLAVQAPHTGATVELSSYTADGVTWRLGRLPPSALTPL